ncbi:class I SAM-dependent methyltransferase [Janibacter sp. G56]|uniref:class I SAM-dependent methyltransferase n=1 Tax=Janibacter sp. G56 TaxID=3418717 RepID=UPI003D00FDB0
MPQSSHGRAPVDHALTAAANRAWWDAEAEDYYEEHGSFLGDGDFVWGPEGWTEEELRVLGDLRGKVVLEIGGGAGQCSRWVRSRGAHAVATDLSGRMLATGAEINARRPEDAVPLAQCDAVALPFADECVDIVFTAYGALPFVADSAGLLREAARVLRPGGRLAFSTTHPFRWALPDVPDAEGLTVTMSYFDRTPYVEVDEAGRVSYVEHHRTLGDRVREITAAGLRLVDVIEPEWPERNTEAWGGWSPLRGELMPGTAIYVATKP